MAPIPLVAAALPIISYLDAKLKLSDDLRIVRALAGGKVAAAIQEKRDRVSCFYLLEDAALNPKHRDQLLLIYQGRRYTYWQMYQWTLSAATWLKERCGVKKDDVVALDFMNSPGFLVLWWGLWALGATPAFINYNLGGDALVHSVKTAETGVVIVDSEVAGKMLTGEEGEKTLQRLKTEGREREVIVYDDSLERIIGTWKAERPPDDQRAGKMLHHKAILIFTSGTTGMPKAAIVSYAKARTGSYFAGSWMGLRNDDVFYTCMPVYHSSAALLGVVNVLTRRSTLALGRKFSNATFWPEVRESGATVIQYVGEVCRYLLAAPPSPLDKQHKVRLAFGNGLRPDIWNQFKERFGIEAIGEFYASTEGTSGSWNLQQGTYGVGAIGRNGSVLAKILGRTVAIVKLDYATELPYRDPKTGFCVKMQPGEPGELLWRLDPNNIERGFQGYFNNPKATNSKILRDVFKKGDAWFRSGDVQTWTSDGLWYFIDRIGDTFRWKSENVATSQVAEALTLFPGVLEANVYGIALPHHDGNAGCAALTLDPTKFPLDSPSAQEEYMRSLAQFITKKEESGLPSFAVPIFLRVKEGGLESTGNYKLVKKGLRDQGVDLEKVCGDQIWWLRGGCYRRFTKGDWEQLRGGKVKL